MEACRDRLWRHEWKHEIGPSDLIALRQRLRAVAFCDPHASDGTYRIRSLYFDNGEDRAFAKSWTASAAGRNSASGIMTAIPR